MLNRIDLEGFRKVQEDYKKNPSKCKKRLQVNGRWRLDVEYGPQFETRLKTERAGEITVQTDETIILGGGGTAVHPVHYCMAGFCGCFSAAFAKWAAMAGIELKKFEIQATADIDLTSGFGIEDGVPAVNNFNIELTVESDANQKMLEEVLELTKKRCFCMYCMTTAVIPEIDMIKEVPKATLEEASFICPNCFNKNMVFQDDNTQICTNCGTKGFFIRDFEKEKIGVENPNK